MSESLTITREWMESLESLPTVQSRWNVLYAAARFAFDGVKPDDLDMMEKCVFMSIKSIIKSRARHLRYYNKSKVKPSNSASNSVSNLDEKNVQFGRNENSDSLFNIKEDQGIFKQDNTINSSKGLKKEKEVNSATHYSMEEKDKKEPSKRKIFVPPTLEEVREYCRYRSNAVNPEQFHAYYSSNGWMVGHGNKMKDWKASVRYWEQRMYQERKKLSEKRDYSGI